MGAEERDEVEDEAAARAVEEDAVMLSCWRTFALIDALSAS